MYWDSGDVVVFVCILCILDSDPGDMAELLTAVAIHGHQSTGATQGTGSQRPQGGLALVSSTQCDDTYLPCTSGQYQQTSV